MAIIDVFVFLAVAKIAVLLFEDVAYAARGKASPRLQQRAAVREGKARPSGIGRVFNAIGGYAAGLFEDGATAARPAQRRRKARKHGRKAVDGMFIEFGNDDRWYADCDVCEWSSRPYRIEANATAAGAEHTANAHPKKKEEDTSEDSTNSPADGGATSDSKPRLTVIPGGAADDSAEEAAPPEPTGTDEVVHDDCTYCLGCPKCAPARRAWAWRCDGCGASETRNETEEDARNGFARHECPARKWVWTCSRCGERGEHTTDKEADAAAATHSQSCRTGPQTRETLPDGNDAALADTTNPADGTDPIGTEPKKENTVNLEATGPEEIRAAFDAAHDTLNSYSEQIGELQATLTEGADRYESLEMAASTVAILRDVAESLNGIETELGELAEQMTSAKADFDASDGAVADTVADSGGNVASKEILVG